MVFDQNKHIEQWNKIENSEINSCTYGELTYNKRGNLQIEQSFVMEWKAGLAIKEENAEWGVGCKGLNKLKL